MKYFKYLILFLPLLFVELTAQPKVNSSPYLSGNLAISNSSFPMSDDNNNSMKAAVGIGFGFPINKEISFYSRFTYTSKPNFTAFDYLTYVDNDMSIINQLTAANISYSQLIFNAGLQYNFTITNGLLLGISSGFTYSIVNQKVSLQNGKMIESMDNEGLYGYFAGANLEKTFDESNFSIFGEAQYNFIKKDLVYYRSKFGGTNFTIGGKYYLSE